MRIILQGALYHSSHALLLQMASALVTLMTC
jgi:hypothetical protein